MTEYWLDKEYILRDGEGDYENRLVIIDEGVWELRYIEDGEIKDKTHIIEDAMPALVEALQDIIARRKKE